MTKHCLILVLFFAPFICCGQTAEKTERAYQESPLWISMMDDPDVNYFEIDKAFNLYFEHHELPEGENEVIGEGNREKIPSKRKQRKIAEESKIRFAVKKYTLWRKLILPYVKEDGSIMTSDERIVLWKSQQQ